MVPIGKFAPETIAGELHDDFDVRLPEGNFDRLMAGIQLVTTDKFYKSLPDFIQLCNILAGDLADDAFDPADVYDISWGLVEATLLAPPDDQDESPYCDDIRQYIGAMLDEVGLLDGPDMLQLGLRNGPDKHQILSQWADDPETLAAIRSRQDEAAQDLTQYVNDRLRTLIAQLAKLPLSNGQLDGVLDDLQRLMAKR